MLHLPEPLLRARGTLTPPDDWPEGATLGSAWCLEAVCAGVSALVADPPLPIDTAGAGVLLPIAGVGDLRPAAGAGDLRSVLARGGSTNNPNVSLASPHPVSLAHPRRQPSIDRRGTRACRRLLVVREIVLGV